MLADRLRADGIDAIIDQYMASPSEGWPAWSEAEISKADFVLMVCSEGYLRQFNRESEPEAGGGGLWEGETIKQHLYRSSADGSKFVPVLLSEGSPASVPTPVRGASIYRAETPEGYEALYRLLTDQPLIRIPGLGDWHGLPDRRREEAAAKGEAPTHS
jgi:hypothetical protein